MIIRKWKNRTVPFRKLPGGFLLVFLTLAAPAAGGPPFPGVEQTVKFRLYPGVQFPLNDDNFSGGPDITAALDWRFFPFLGASGQFGYVNLPVAGSGTVRVLDAGLGPVFVWRPASRLSLKADITGGLYQARWNEQTISGLSLGGRLSAAWHLSPSIAGMVFGSYKQYTYTPRPFLSSFTVGAGISLDLGEMIGRKVRIEVTKTSQEMVFPVSYAWYNEHPFATVRITNREPTILPWSIPRFTLNNI
jgi:hypothetical protein